MVGEPRFELGTRGFSVLEISIGSKILNGHPEGTRTPRFHLERVMTLTSSSTGRFNGAGNGNRTRVVCMASRWTTTVLFPQVLAGFIDLSSRRTSQRT